MKAFKPSIILTLLIGMVCLLAACTGLQTNTPTTVPAVISTTAPPEPSPTFVPPTNTPVPPSATPTTTPTSERPAASPTISFTLATSAEEIIGTWYETNLYIRFDEDGTFRQANALGDLESRPYAICSFQFEGPKMVIKEISVMGVPSCGDKIGKYEVQKLANGNIKIMTISDGCRPRSGDTAGEKMPVASPAP